MNGGIATEYLSHIVERPNELNVGGRGRRNAILAESLKNLSGTKALCFDEGEFLKEFGKNGRVSIRAAMKIHGLRVKVARHNGKMYLWALPRIGV